MKTITQSHTKYYDDDFQLDMNVKILERSIKNPWKLHD